MSTYTITTTGTVHLPCVIRLLYKLAFSTFTTIRLCYRYPRPYCHLRSYSFVSITIILLTSSGLSATPPSIHFVATLSNFVLLLTAFHLCFEPSIYFNFSKFLFSLYTRYGALSTMISLLCFLHISLKKEYMIMLHLLSNTLIGLRRSI